MWFEEDSPMPMLNIFSELINYQTRYYRSNSRSTFVHPFSQLTPVFPRDETLNLSGLLHTEHSTVAPFPIFLIIFFCSWKDFDEDLLIAEKSSFTIFNTLIFYCRLTKRLGAIKPSSFICPTPIKVCVSPTVIRTIVLSGAPKTCTG